MPYPDLSFADVSSAVVHQVCFQMLTSMSISVFFTLRIEHVWAE